MGLPIYYKLHDELSKMKSSIYPYNNIHGSISAAAIQAFEVFDKYYISMDGSDAYYIAVFLDPRFKNKWFKKQLQDEEAGPMITKAIIETIKKEYPPLSQEKEQEDHQDNWVADMLKDLKKSLQEVPNDVDAYFNSELVSFSSKDIRSDEIKITEWWKNNHG